MSVRGPKFSFFSSGSFAGVFSRGKTSAQTKARTNLNHFESRFLGSKMGVSHLELLSFTVGCRVAAADSASDRAVSDQRWLRRHNLIRLAEHDSCCRKTEMLLRAQNDSSAFN